MGRFVGGCGGSAFDRLYGPTTCKCTVTGISFNDYDFLCLGFDKILFYGATSVQVLRRTRALMNELLSTIPEERRPALLYWQGRLQTRIKAASSDTEDILITSDEDRQGLGSSRRPRPAS